MKFSIALSIAFVTAWFAGVAEAQTDQIIYDDARQNGWQDYGWAALNYASATTAHGGSASISVTAGGNQALYLHHAAFDTSGYTALTFWIHGGTAGGQQLQVQALLGGVSQPAVALATLTANSWQKITLPLANLGAANKANMDGFWIQNRTSSAAPTFYVDDIALAVAAPPSTVHLAVNAQTTIRTIDARIFGINTAIWDAQIGSAANATLVSAMGLNSFRFPGGSISDSYDWQRNRSIGGTFDWATNFPKFARMVESLGAQAYVTVNYGDGTPEQAAAWVAYANAAPSSAVSIGVDAKGRNWQTAGYWAGLRAASPLAVNDGYNFLRIAHPAPFAFRYWEVGNENYGNWENDKHGVAGSGLTGVVNDPFTYAQYFKTFRDAMLAVDSTIAIGAPVVAGEDSYGNGTHAVPNPNHGNALHSGWTPVVLATLKTLGVAPHFVIYHSYAQEPGGESDAGLLQSAGGFATTAAGLRQQLTDYVGGAMGAGVELAVTELNSVSYNPGKQTVSLVNGLFFADALGSMARTEFNACQWWDLRNGSATANNNSATLYGWRPFGDYGVLAAGDRGDTPVNTPFPAYYAAKLLTHWGRGGDAVVSATSDYAGLSIHAARLAGGGLALLVVNKHATADLNAEIALTSFVPGSATAAAWSYGKTNDSTNGDLTTANISNAAATFARTFPSYSMTVIVLAKPLTPLESWRLANFGISENSGNAADSADPDGDGLKNLLEYWLVSPPQAPSAGALPIFAPAAGGCTFTYRRRVSATDATYLVEESDNLQTWTPAAGASASLGTNGDAETIRFSVPKNAERRYYRLSVSAP